MGLVFHSRATVWWPLPWQILVGRNKGMSFLSRSGSRRSHWGKKEKKGSGFVGMREGRWVMLGNGLAFPPPPNLGCRGRPLLPILTHPCNLHAELPTRYVGLLLHSKETRPPRAPVPIICTSAVIPRVTFFCKRIESKFGFGSPLSSFPSPPFLCFPRQEGNSWRKSEKQSWVAGPFYAEHLGAFALQGE